MINIPMAGTDPTQRAVINGILMSFPDWFLLAARVSRIEMTFDEMVKQQIAMYNHGSRLLQISQGVGGELLRKAIGHELGHAIDDNFGEPHFFSSTDRWRNLHRDQAYFDIPKYRDEPLEYFGDMITKLFLNPGKLRVTNPGEALFIESYVFPTLKKAFGGN